MNPLTISKTLFVNGAVADLNYLYGPYDSVSAATTAVTSTVRAKGLTLGITTTDGIVEYWFKNGITDSDLVVKSTSTSSGTSSNIVVTNTAVTETTTYLNSTYSTAAVGDRVVDTTTGSSYLKYNSTGWVKIAGTILTDSAPTVATVASASVLSYK